MREINISSHPLVNILWQVQAEDSYSKATELKPDETLAWQGLASLYENSKVKDGLSEINVKLIKAYRQLLVCYKSNAEKHAEVSE